MKPALKPPFSYFGIKTKVAALVWEHFGSPDVYLEPFFGAGAVLLGRPCVSGVEMVNDLDCYIANFWRALQQEPDVIAKYLPYPVTETDIVIRYEWLSQRRVSVRESVQKNYKYYDAEVAGIWLWLVSLWWGEIPLCKGKADGTARAKRPRLGSDFAGRRYGDRGLKACQMWLATFTERMRKVRVLCGDWKRAIPSTAYLATLGTTAVFLDPPYGYATQRCKQIYSEESGSVASAVCEWALKHGGNPNYRIALCGLEGEHEMPKEWEKVGWDTGGGFGTNYGAIAKRGALERIWFSPHCIRRRLFL
jgi:hypothetical protein